MTVFPPAKHDALGLEVRERTVAMLAKASRRHGCPCAVWHTDDLALPCHSTRDAVRFTHDYCTYSSLVQQELLTPEELAIRDRVRRFAVSSAQHRAEAGQRPWGVQWQLRACSPARP